MNRIAEQEAMEESGAEARLAQLEADVQILLRRLGQKSAAPGSGHAFPGEPGICPPRPGSSAPSAARFDFAAVPDAGRTRRLAEDRSRARFVRQLIRRRRRREQFLPADLFADPAWDMLLDLYAAHYEGRVVSVSSLSIAAAVPATTALRWIKTMTDMGAFIRIADPADGRRVHVLLSDDMRQRLDQYFENFDE